ncbi:MAG: hypothetical protein H3C27_01185 [Opitutaceae bacterium]|nr:hypothetical protein [Opitutaceae bacterium]
MKPPSYFTNIEANAVRRWDQLESDPELAGPWHQLFRQVQSPRHVISELLQNADDAGATWANVVIDEEIFGFSHNGADFTEEQFASLCRFGFSNKRTLHTIGFRGVGFKSTFSLGEVVEVFSPTLAISFSKKRFTQPRWLNLGSPSEETRIQVRHKGSQILSELKKNLNAWINSPPSLFFFNHLDQLTFGQRKISRETLGAGPTGNSTRVRLLGGKTREYILIRSEPKPFPDEAIREIKAERGFLTEEFELPPCRVEVLLARGEKHRLYVVLPTEVNFDLPFSCNAPFVQDPARFAIKDPSISPTNRWLLKRLGELAAKTMLQWLQNSQLSLKERSLAYDLLVECTEYEADICGTCSRLITESMHAVLNGESLILTYNGDLVEAGQATALPHEVFDVWEPDVLKDIFAPGECDLVAPELSEDSIQTLVGHGWIDESTPDDILDALEEEKAVVPRPLSWPKLHRLWCFVQEHLQYDWNSEHRRQMKLVPVDGDSWLYAANAVVRLPIRRELLAKDDWRFLMDNARTLDTEWLDWLVKYATQSSKPNTPGEEPALKLLKQLGLHEASNVDRIAALASLRIFDGSNVQLVDCVRITQILAALGATVPEGFRFVTRDLHLRGKNHGIVADETGRIEDLVLSAWAQEHLLHASYTEKFQSCKSDVWRQWIRREGSGLWVSVPLMETSDTLFSRADVEKFATQRGGHAPTVYPYRRNDFTTLDHSYPPMLLKHWVALAQEHRAIWSEVLGATLLAPSHTWSTTTEAIIYHNGASYKQRLDCNTIVADWIQRFRGLSCLPDTHGRLYLPAELFLRTPDTEPLIGVEPFVRPELDNEQTRPLLKLLGVRDTPTGSDKLLKRLLAWSGAPRALDHLGEITRICEALDRIAVRCSTTDLAPMVESFRQQALILTQTGDWLSSSEVSVLPGENGESPSVHAALRDLSLWLRIGVAQQPAFERTIAWLKSLTSGATLDAPVARRVRMALQRDPVRVWSECGHWLSLESTWERTNQLRYRLTMQSLMRWGDLFASVKRSTANFQMLSRDQVANGPWSDLPELGDRITYQVTKFDQDRGQSRLRPWLVAIAGGLARIIVTDEKESERLLKTARRLRETVWCSFTRLDVTPYLDAIPAGSPFSPNVLWKDEKLYVAVGNTAKIYQQLADELSQPFGLPAIANAFSACIERDTQFIAEYLATNFRLSSEEPVHVSPGTGSKGSDDQEGKSENGATVTEPESYPDGEGDHDEHDASTGDVPNLPTNNADPPKLPPIPPKPKLIDIYARQHGYHWDQKSNRYRDSRGGWMGRSEAPFQWEEHDRNGNLTNRIWVTEQKLSTGIEIAAELWGLIEHEPEHSALISQGEDHQPRYFPGTQLVKMKQDDKLRILPSRYRIVHA